MTNSWLTITIFTLTLLSILAVNSISAQSIPQPPSPEFALKFLKASYTITTIYNGTTMTQQFDNSTIELVIKPYNYTFNASQYYPSDLVPTFHFYYDIQVKKPSEQTWTDLYPLESKISNYATGAHSDFISSKNNLPASNISEVKLVFQVKTYPLGTDFQVRVILGHDAIAFISSDSYSPWGQNADDGTFVNAVIFDTVSNWSQTQTVNLPEPSPTPTMAMPTRNEDALPLDYHQYFLKIYAIIMAVIVLSVLGLYLRDKMKNRQKT